MITYQATIEHPEGLDIFAVDENGDYVVGNEVYAVLAGMRAQWPDGNFPATEPRNGRELTHALIDIDSDDPAQFIDDAIAYFGLDWSLLGLCSVYLYPEYDDLGEPVLDDDGHHVRSQIVERAVPEALFLPYMIDEYDDSDPPVLSRPTEAAIHHTWDGCEPVALG